MTKGAERSVGEGRPGQHHNALRVMKVYSLQRLNQILMCQCAATVRYSGQTATTHCNTLQHTLPRSNTRQHNTTHYNTLQHIATR